ncbi:MAG: hypothetical protein VB074_04500 [Proteiniphilum sp.]|jgi:hypothetical protein|uniref:hypothetical protein n=1 Tax=Proteiniphilum sp. TaxID=1926877 RepID=UPI00268A695F|nr:hypothetical protein [Proteiniphilum sp.]MEA5127421.1 hypothetical protein [Proteiniphilum sp.]
MSDINERIRKILNTQFEGNVSKMARQYGIPQPTLNNIVGNRMSKPSFENIKRIINSDETINARWLITGKGAMLKIEKDSIEAQSMDNTYLLDRYEKIIRENERLRMEIEQLNRLSSSNSPGREKRTR